MAVYDLPCYTNDERKLLPVALLIIKKKKKKKKNDKNTFEEVCSECVESSTDWVCLEYTGEADMDRWLLWLLWLLSDLNPENNLFFHEHFLKQVF